MAGELFRQKSLDRVNSPEDLNEYLQVTSPGVWLLVGAIIVLLVGAIAWGAFGRIIVSTDAPTIVNNGQAICVVDETKASSVTPGMSVVIGEVEGHIDSIETQSTTLANVVAELDSNYTETDMNRKVRVAYATIGMPNGGYTAKVILETVTPFSFILN